jgi:hypothetical protein
VTLAIKIEPPLRAACIIEHDMIKHIGVASRIDHAGAVLRLVETMIVTVGSSNDHTCEASRREAVRSESPVRVAERGRDTTATDRRQPMQEAIGAVRAANDLARAKARLKKNAVRPRSRSTRDRASMSTHAGSIVVGTAARHRAPLNDQNRPTLAEQADRDSGQHSKGVGLWPDSQVVPVA